MENVGWKSCKRLPPNVTSFVPGKGKKLTTLKRSLILRADSLISCIDGGRCEFPSLPEGAALFRPTLIDVNW